jgi:hypothetical protein
MINKSLITWTLIAAALVIVFNVYPPAPSVPDFVWIALTFGLFALTIIRKRRRRSGLIDERDVVRGRSMIVSGACFLVGAALWEFITLRFGHFSSEREVILFSVAPSILMLLPGCVLFIFGIFVRFGGWPRG